MDAHIDIIAYLDNDLSLDEIKQAEDHMQTCRQCRETVDLFKKSEKIDRSLRNLLNEPQDEGAMELDMPGQENWRALPDSLKNMLVKKRTTKAKIIESILALVEKTSPARDRSGLLGEVSLLADRLLSDEPLKAPSYAFDRRHAGPAPTELELRPASFPSDLHIQMDDYEVAIHHDESGTHIRMAKDGRAIKNGVVTIGKKENSVGLGVFKTDPDGVVKI